MKPIIIFVAAIVFFFLKGCNENNHSNKPEEITLSVIFKDGKFKIESENSKILDVNGIYLSIKDDTDNSVFSFKRLSLLQIGQVYISESIDLQHGNYMLEDFLIVNSKDSVVYIAPKKGSTYAHLVDSPLALDFGVFADQDKTVHVDVLPANREKAFEYGYTHFSVDIFNPLYEGLILYFPFNGSFEEYGSGNFPFKVIGPELSTGVNGKSETAAYFNGMGAHIDLNNGEPIITGKQFTIASWVKLNGLGGVIKSHNALFQQRDDDATGTTSKSTIVLVVDNSDHQISFGIRDNESLIEVFVYPAPAYNEWHHITTTLNEASEVGIYIDGKKVLNSNYSGNYNFVTSVDNVSIGIHSYFNNQLKGALNGEISDFRIYNRALSEKEIKDLYHLRK